MLCLWSTLSFFNSIFCFVSVSAAALVSTCLLSSCGCVFPYKCHLHLHLHLCLMSEFVLASASISTCVCTFAFAAPVLMHTLALCMIYYASELTLSINYFLFYSPPKCHLSHEQHHELFGISTVEHCSAAIRSL